MRSRVLAVLWATLSCVASNEERLFRLCRGKMCLCVFPLVVVNRCAIPFCRECSTFVRRSLVWYSCQSFLYLHSTWTPFANSWSRLSQEPSALWQYCSWVCRLSHVTQNVFVCWATQNLTRFC